MKCHAAVRNPAAKVARWPALLNGKPDVPAVLDNLRAGTDSFRGRAGACGSNPACHPSAEADVESARAHLATSLGIGDENADRHPASTGGAQQRGFVAGAKWLTTYSRWSVGWASLCIWQTAWQPSLSSLSVTLRRPFQRSQASGSGGCSANRFSENHNLMKSCFTPCLLFTVDETVRPPRAERHINSCRVFAQVKITLYTSQPKYHY